MDDATIKALREATPGCHDRVHLNNAGASLMTRSVLDAQIEHLELESQLGGYEAADAARQRIEAVYGSCAGLIGALPHQIALVENATVAWNLAFHSLRLGPGDRVITSEADYGANFITYLQAVAHRGIELSIAPSDSDGATDVAALAELVDDRTRLIAITHTPTNGGLVNPAEAIGRVAREANVPYLLDACQTVGQLDLDVDRIGCDFLSATGRKYLRGPRGTGFLFVGQAMLDRVDPPLEPAMLDHHGASWTGLESYEIRPDARRFENWEFNYAAVLGLGQAADEALALGLDRIEDRVTSLAESLRQKLASIGLTAHDLGARRCGIVTTAIPGWQAAAVKEALAAEGVNVSTSSPASTLVDATRRQLPTLVRLSVHYFNTEGELDRAVAVLADL